MKHHQKRHEIIDVQNRRILYTNSEIIRGNMTKGLSEETPQHFVAIFTQPDYIYMDKHNKVHVYHKHMKGKKHTVTTFEITRGKMKFFKLNSWFTEIDDTASTLQTMIEANRDPEVRKQVDDKIEDSKSWMEVLYENHDYMGSDHIKKELGKKGITIEPHEHKKGKAGKKRKK